MILCRGRIIRVSLHLDMCFYNNYFRLLPVLSSLTSQKKYSMTKFESSVKQIAHSQQSVYNTLSDLNNVQRLKERLPEGSTGNDDMDKVKERLQNITFDQDSLSMTVDPVGQISMRIIERDEPKTIKFESDNSPLSFNFWIQILPVTESSSKMKLTIDADIPFFAKGMVSKPLQEGIEKIADALAMIPFE